MKSFGHYGHSNQHIQRYFVYFECVDSLLDGVDAVFLGLRDGRIMKPLFRLP